MAQIETREFLSLHGRLGARGRVVCFALGVFLAGCAQKTAQTPSTDQAGYAERYPAALSGVRTGFAQDEQLARTTMSKFASYPSKVKSADPGRVRRVVELADAAGASADFAGNMREANQVSAFYAEEKAAIQQRVGGSVNYTAKEKGCDVDLYGAAAGAMDKSVEKQLQERSRSRNPAQRFIDDNEDALGKANTESLKEQADEIALTSYIVRLRLSEERAELEEMVDGASEVKQTLQRSLNEANAALRSPNASKSAKTTQQQHANDASAALKSIDAEVESARRAIKALDDRIKNARRGYDTALANLKKALQGSAGSR